MNNHIFQTLVNWNNLSETKNFQRDFANSYELKKEIKALQEPVNHIEEFLSMSYLYYVGVIATQFIFFLLRRTTIGAALISFIIITIYATALYSLKYRRKNKKNQIELQKKQAIIDAFDNQIKEDLYNLSNFELMDEEYKKYCFSNGLEKQYNSFKLALINQNLENFQILAFYDFMQNYCKENINNTPIGNIKVKTANSSSDNYNFFSK